MARISNPFAFRPGPVTVLTTLVYAALIISLVIVHTTLPSSPRSAVPFKNINLTEAVEDLKIITNHYHPYNSHANDYVRQFLLERIDEILESNGANVTYPAQVGYKTRKRPEVATEPAQAFIFDDLSANITCSQAHNSITGEGISAYFEGTNIIVYIRGSDDDKTHWWETPNRSPSGHGAVMVNAHYDSVSTGFGATDDGMGVVSVLQLIRYYSAPENVPRRGFVALLNNGEEDFLNGARAFGLHPMAKFTHTFVNLEGAGAGGRAHMFRGTDTEVVQAYANSPFPFSSVSSGDGFKLGVIQSQTDYVVFDEVYGMRGVDVSFMEPRARYHTDADDTRHTGRDSLWHMLSAALATTKSLTSEKGDKFDGEPRSKGTVPSGKGSNGVWFDLFGRGFAVARLHTFFALSVTLLVVAPILLLLVSIVLHKVDRYYGFSSSRLYAVADGDEEIKLYGWRGFFRFPVILIISAAVTLALAFLVNKQNPFIVHSSPWALWAMLFSSFFFVAWFCCCAAYFTRPSALTRFYAYVWLFVLFWAFLVVDTVAETNFQLGGGYPFVFYFAAIFVVTLLSHLELFALPRKSKYCHGKMEGYGSMGTSQIISPERNEDTEATNDDGEEDEATESTSLLGGQRRQTFANYTRTDAEREEEPPRPTDDTEKTDDAYPNEQEWSAPMPRWLWLLQAIILVPVAVIFILPLGFVFVSGTYQTGADGSETFLPYLIQAVCVILILLPLLPILHRFTWHIPIFLLLVLVGTLIYNLTAFPFADNHRLKLFFQQTVDLDTGHTNVTLRGPQPFVLQSIANLPSSQGKEISCGPVRNRIALDQCSWAGLPPQVAPRGSFNESRENKYRSWVTFNVTRPSPATPSKDNSARFEIGGRNTRACKIMTDGKPISNFQVLDAGPDDKRFESVPDAGSTELRLWSRTWDRTWTVDVEWSDDEYADDGAPPGLQGRIVCLWSDQNQLGLIPALDEVRHYAPIWSTVTKASDGLVDGYKRFSI